MTDALRVILEIGKKRRVVAGAMDWPGLDRWGTSEDDALGKLSSYLPRYAGVAEVPQRPQCVQHLVDLEVILERSLPRLAHCSQVSLTALERSPALGGRPYEPGAAVVGISRPFQVAQLDELGDEFAHPLVCACPVASGDVPGVGASGRSLLRRGRLPVCFCNSVQMIRGMSLAP